MSFAYCLTAQELEFKAPDYSSIEKNIKDKDSKFYYPTLEKRLRTFDTSLSEEEYLHLYFGFTFQNQYKPYKRNPNQEKIMSLQKKGINSKSDTTEMMDLLKASINDFPFDLQSLSMLNYFYDKTGDKENYIKTKIQFEKIVDAILSTGNGKDCKTGFHVISTSHEYMIIYLLGLDFTTQALTEDQCDAMSVSGDNGKFTMYFDVKRLFEANRE